MASKVTTIATHRENFIGSAFGMGCAFMVFKDYFSVRLN
jgi:hypothetical protein